MSIVKTVVVSAAVVGVTVHYWVLPAVDSVTPWDGALPGSCGQPAQARPAGLVGLANDTGRLLDRLEQGPPTPAEMVGWFRDAGSGARTAWVAFDVGTDGQQLLPLAQSPVPLPAMQVNSPNGSHLTDAQVAALSLEVGWPAEQIPQVVARVRAESSGNPNARDYADGTHHGLLQLGTAEQAQYLDPGQSAFDPRANLTGALRLWQARGWQPWAASDSASVVQPVSVTPVACTPDFGVMQAAHDESDLDPVALPARRAVLAAFGPMTVGGWGTRGNATEHDELDAHGRRASRALDFMVEGAKGDAVAQYLIDHAAPLRVDYLIWDRRIWSSRHGWRPYHGASPHTDHVHVTILKAAERTSLAG